MTTGDGPTLSRTTVVSRRRRTTTLTRTTVVSRRRHITTLTRTTVVSRRRHITTLTRTTVVSRRRRTTTLTRTTVVSRRRRTTTLTRTTVVSRRRRTTTLTRTPRTGATAKRRWRCRRMSQVMLTDWARWRRVIDVKAVGTRPAPSVAPNTFNIEDFLRRRHHLVERVTTSVPGIRVTARLYSLYFR